MQALKCAFIVACLMAVASAEFYLVVDDQSLRMVANDTGMTSTVNSIPLLSGTVAPFGSLRGLSLDQKNQLFYGADATNEVVVQIDPKVSPWAMKIVAGTKGVAGNTDGAASAASFTNPRSTAVAADGSIVVAQDGAIRKISPDLTTVMPFAGRAAAAGFADGAGTNAQFNNPASVFYDSNGLLYVVSATAVRTVTPDATVATVAGSAANGFADAIGTSATFTSASVGAVSADATTVYVADQAADTTYAGGNLGAAVIRKIDVASGTVTTVAGATTATGSSADGLGTSAVITGVSGLTVDGANNVIFTESCGAGGVVRRFTPGATIAAGSTGLVAGSYTGATCTIATAVAAGLSSTDGAAASAKFKVPTSVLAVQKICGDFFPAGSDPVISKSCSDVGSGSVKSLDAKSKVVIVKVLVVAGVLNVSPGGSLEVNAPVTVNDAFVVTGNGTVVLNDNDVVANSLSLTDSSVYQIFISKDLPGRFKIRNLAVIAGTFVLQVKRGFAFGVGKSVPVVDFGSFSGAVKETFIVFLASRRAERGLLQNAGGATTACTGNQCRATGTAIGADDDDEIPFIVALIVVAALLFIGIAAAVYFASTGGLPKFGNDAPASAAAAPYGNTAAALEDFDYSSSSSSSSSSGDGFFFQPGYSYSY